MRKLIKAITLALVGLCMASAHAADAKFDAFMQTVSGNKTTVTFGSGGTPVLTSSAPLGTPSIGNMGFETSGGDVYMRSKGSAKLPTGGTVPIDTKLKLTRNALAKGLAKSTLFYTAWETGSALYDIWTDFGLNLDASTGTVSQGVQGTSSAFSGTWKRQYGTVTGTPEYVCEEYRDNGFILQSTRYWGPLQYTQSSSTRIVCTLRQYTKSTNSLAGTWTANIDRQSTDCPSGTSLVSGVCTSSSIQILTQQQLEQRVSELLASEGWPTADARAAADALRIPQVQAEVLPLIEAQPQTDTQVQVQGIPQGTPFQVGDPVTTTTTQTNSDGTTSEKVQTTTTTATATGNTIQTQRQTQTTTTTRDATGVVTGTTTATTTTAQTATTPATENEDLECGLPGGPACRIDETGTPELEPSTVEQDVDNVFAPLQACIDDLTACVPELPDLNWTFALPSHCGPIAIPAFAPYLSSINVCQFQGLFHDLMSMIWAAAGLFGAISLVFRDATGS